MTSSIPSAYFQPILGVLGFLLILLSIVWAPLLTVVWLPDIWFQPNRVLSDFHVPTGERFVITEQWTDDFYLQNLQITQPSGDSTDFVIDGDGSKIWWNRHEIIAGKNLVRFYFNDICWADYNLSSQSLRIYYDFVSSQQLIPAP